MEYWRQQYHKLMRYKAYRFLAVILGLPITVMLLIHRYLGKRDGWEQRLRASIRKAQEAEGTKRDLVAEELVQLQARSQYFKEAKSARALALEAHKHAERQLRHLEDLAVQEAMKEEGRAPASLANSFSCLSRFGAFQLLFYSLGLPLLLLLLVFSLPFVKYSMERILMLIFVVLGVTLVVFTILYISPTDPARNILGEFATEEQVRDWRETYGMNDSYWVQAGRAMMNVFRFDFGTSFVGNEAVMPAIMRKFPVTLKVAMASLFISILIAVPAGIVSAIKQYSLFDFSAMIAALIGLSIPNFWLGLMLILFFSVKLGWLNVIYSDSDWKALIMPAVVIGTSLAASVARMTRSSMLEVIKSDYITTARAKGLSERVVVLRHALKNAVIPIVTIIGLQFGGMLGGSAVTEKVFTIPGIGSYIVNKQMIPDIPVVLAGVVYIAIVISFANLLVDLLYALFDPRIKAKIRAY